MSGFPVRLDTVFFDMDGVLYDSMKNHVTTWVGSFRKYGVDFPPEEAYLNEGRTGDSTIERTFKRYLNREASAEEIEGIYDEKVRLMHDCPEPLIFPAMQELIRMLERNGTECYVVTGSRQPSLLAKIERDFGIGQSRVVSGFDVKRGKPDPEPYLIALKKSGSDKKNCIVIENAPLGIQSAKCAGIYTIAINTGILDDEVLIRSGADELFHDSIELYERLLKTSYQVAEQK